MNISYSLTSMSRLFVYVFLFLFMATNRALAADSLNREDTVHQFEQLTAYNNGNEKEGNPDLNWDILTDNTGPGEPMSDWMFNGSAYFEAGPGSKDPLLSLLNERLKAYNEDRGKDGPHVFFLITGGMYFLKDKFTVKAVDDLTNKNGQIEFDKAGILKLGDLTVDAALFFKDRARIPELVWNTLNQLSQRGYDNTIVYTINLFEFLRISDIPQGTTWDWKDIDRAGKSRTIKYETYNRGKGFKDKSMMDRIVNQSRKDLPKPNLSSNDAVFAYLSVMIDNLIKAIHTEYDKSKESTNDKNLTDCGKFSDFRKTWPVNYETYQAAVESMADLYVNHNDKDHQIRSKYMIADYPGRFAILPDNDKNYDKDFFLGGEWQDKLELLPKYNQRAFEIDLIFAKVDFFIPEGEARTKFAEDVSLAIFKKSGTDGGEKALIVVPYYLCDDSPFSTPLLMGAAYTDDENFKKKMNDAFISRRGIRWAVEDVFRSVPKKHITYTVKVDYTSQVITNVVESGGDVSGFTNFVDIVVLIDHRANEMQQLLHYHCTDDVAKEATKLGYIGGAASIAPELFKKFFDECTAKNLDGIRAVIAQNPTPKYDVLTQDGSNISSNLIQSLLLGDNGSSLAADYMMAAVDKADLLFFNGGAIVGLDYGTMTDELFYNGQNPFHKDHWILTVIETAINIAYFIPGLDVIAGGTGALYYLIKGDNTQAAIAVAGILVPPALVKGARVIKNARVVRAFSQASADALRAGTKRVWRVFARGSTELTDVAVIATDLIKVPNAADHLLIGTGVLFKPEAIKIIDDNPVLREALEKSFYRQVGDEIVINSAIPYKDLDVMVAKLNDPAFLKRYEEVLKSNPGIDLHTFFRIEYEAAGNVLFQTDEALEKISKWIKHDDRYIYVYVHGNSTGFFLVLKDLNVSISHLQIADWLVGQEVFVNALREGKNIKLISCNSAASDAAKDLSARLSELSKVPDSKIAGLSPTIEAPSVPYGIDEFGKEGSEKAGGKWFSFKDGAELGPVKENPDIPQFGKGIAAEVKTAIPAPNGTIKTTDPNYIIYVTSEGKERIRFRASEAVTAQFAKPGRLYTTEGAAALTENGEVFVMDGRHRAIGAAHGDKIGEDLGGVGPDVLDYEFERPRDPIKSGVKVRDLTIDYSAQDLSKDQADLLYYARTSFKDSEKAENAIKLFENLADQSYKDLLEVVKADRKFPQLSETEEAILRYYQTKGNQEIGEALRNKNLIPYLEAQKIAAENIIRKLPDGAQKTELLELTKYLPKVNNPVQDAYNAFKSAKSGDLIKKVVTDRENDQAFLKDVFDQHPPKDQFVGSSQRDYVTGFDNKKAADDVANKVTYLDKSARTKYELKVKDGQCYVNGTMVGDTGGGGLKFVMDGKGNIYVGEASLSHSSFVEGADVALAGSIEFKDGRITLLDNYSGHYKPLGAKLESGLSDFVRELGYRGVDVTQIKFNYIQNVQ